MQAVGYLIGLGADIAGMYVVNGPAEGIKGNFLKLRQKSAQFSVNGNPEGRPASQDVFIKTGLAFMQAHQVYRLCCGIRERGINVLLKDSVSAFMDGTEDRGYGVRLMIMIRNPDISAAQGCGEWMRTLCRSSGIEVKPDIRKKQILHLFLGIDVVCPFQADKSGLPASLILSSSGISPSFNSAKMPSIVTLSIPSSYISRSTS